jgi:hypothetical protein
MRRQGVEENCLMRNFISCTLLQGKGKAIPVQAVEALRVV